MLTSRPLGATHRDFAEQRIGDRRLGRLKRALVALGLARAHERGAHIRHHGADVREVEVDEALFHHQIGNAGHARAQYVVGAQEGVGEGGLLARDQEQVLVRNDDKGIDFLGQVRDAGLGGAHPALPLELERLRHHRDREHAKLLGGACDDGGRPRASAAAHAGGDEQEMHAFKMRADLLDGFLGRRGADLGLRARAKAFGYADAHLNDAAGAGCGKSLRVRVGDDELDAFKAAFDHIVHSVAASAANANDGDPRPQLSQAW